MLFQSKEYTNDFRIWSLEGPEGVDIPDLNQIPIEGLRNKTIFSSLVFDLLLHK
jgi:hypothetical protein